MFSFSIATVDKVLFEGDVEYVIAPGSGGELTLLSHHMPLITTLQKGEVRIQAAGEEKDLQKFEVRGGLLEVANNRAIILV